MASIKPYTDILFARFFPIRSLHSARASYLSGTFRYEGVYLHVRCENTAFDLQRSRMTLDSCETYVPQTFDL